MNLPLDYLRFVADVALSVPDQLTLRPYEVTITTITWSGERVGLGTSTDGYTIVKNFSSTNPRYRQVSQSDVVSSGGKLTDQDIVIGPIVFPYNTSDGYGGTAVSAWEPISTNPQEVYIKVTGPTLPASGLYYKKIYETADRNIMYRVYLRNTAADIPL